MTGAASQASGGRIAKTRAGAPEPATRRSGAATSQAPRAGTLLEPDEPFELPEPSREGRVVDGQVGGVAGVDAERVDPEADHTTLDEQLAGVGREAGEGGPVGIAEYRAASCQ